MTAPPLRVWFGRTVHRREIPFTRSFSYPIAMIDLDIDRLDEAGKASQLFAVNRTGLVAFRETDHGARDAATPLRIWAETQLSEAGISLDGGPIRLMTFPRVLSHGFAPISIWSGFGPDDALRGVIYEVHNTFGEAHAYVTPCPDSEHFADKEFFVSPFFDVTGRYRFTLRLLDEKMSLIVENFGAEGRAHVASMTLGARPVSDRAILGWLTKMPLSGLGVVLAIHWQALLLFFRGARYHMRPVQRANRKTLALPATPPAREEDLRKRA